MLPEVRTCAIQFYSLAFAQRTEEVPMPLQSRVPFGAIFDPPWFQQNFSRLRILFTTLHEIPRYSISSSYRSGSHRSEKICVQHAVVSAHVFQTLSPGDVSEPRLYTNISSSSIFTIRTIISNVAVSTSVALSAWVGSASTIIVKIRTNDLM